MTILQEIQSKDVKSQEKYGFDVRDGNSTVTFAPFDTQEAAQKTRQALLESNCKVSDVRVIWTVATARSLAAVRKARMAPAADQGSAAAKAS